MWKRLSQAACSRRRYFSRLVGVFRGNLRAEGEAAGMRGASSTGVSAYGVYMKCRVRELCEHAKKGEEFNEFKTKDRPPKTTSNPCPSHPLQRGSSEVAHRSTLEGRQRREDGEDLSLEGAGTNRCMAC